MSPSTESVYEPATLAVLDAWKNRGEPGLGRATLICIDGPAGSGKSTLAGVLAERWRATLVHMDDLYLGWSGRDQGISILHADILASMAQGKPGHYRRFDWGLNALAEPHEVDVSTTLIVEGCGSANRLVDQYKPIIVWVETSDEERLLRGMVRDGEGARPQWVRWMAAERELYEREDTRQRAHVRLDGYGRLVSHASRVPGQFHDEGQQVAG